jgi:hypothetical protein
MTALTVGTTEAISTMSAVLCDDAGHLQGGDPCADHLAQAGRLVDALNAVTGQQDGCVHVFPDRTRCTLTAEQHRGVVGLPELHQFGMATR